MKSLMKWANEYIARSDWKTVALLKICLCAMGVMIGLSIPKEKRKITFLIAISVFTATYVPLMIKYVLIATGKDGGEN